MLNMSGGEVIARMLQAEGVTKVFGIIDGTYFGFYSSLEKYGIELITPRHETSAVHMAATYARLTGKLGVCMASNGPGVANALPGVAVENSEGNRVLLVTSCRRVGIAYPDRGGTYQCFDQTGVIGAMAKYSETVSAFERIPEITRQALRKAYQGRPGVVHIDIPENLMNGKQKISEQEFWEPHQYRRTTPITPSSEEVAHAASLLANAEFPVIHAGSGILHALAFEELKAVAEVLHAPVTSSWGGRGVIEETHPLAVPMVHVDLNNEIRTAADVILTLGSRLGETDWWGKAPNWANPADQKMIQVDIDDDFLGRNKPAELNILADVKVFLKELHKHLASMQNKMELNKRRDTYEKFKTKEIKSRQKLDEHLKEKSDPMISAHVAPICQQVFEKDAVVVFDGGNANIWGQFFHKVTAVNTIITTPKLGMLGAGVSQTLAAKVACPEQQVYCIIGDGAMGFHPQEIETAVRNNLKVVFLVLCDKQWGMVKMNQQFTLKPLKTVIKKSLDESETINADLGEIEFDKLAESMGAYGERVSDPDRLEAAVRRAQAASTCAVIHVDVDPVKHMWAPSLMHFKKMHEEPKGK